MKITIQIEDATPAALAALAQITGIQIVASKTKTAPHGLKKDGTPAKKRGRPAAKVKA
jgi:hypothetical protein